MSVGAPIESRAGLAPSLESIEAAFAIWQAESSAGNPTVQSVTEMAREIERVIAPLRTALTRIATSESSGSLAIDAGCMRASARRALRELLQAETGEIAQLRTKS